MLDDGYSTFKSTTFVCDNFIIVLRLQIFMSEALTIVGPGLVSLKTISFL